jgi:uncharacterized protein (TIGR02453 family)
VSAWLTPVADGGRGRHPASVRYFDDETLAFLRELKRHNDRDWFSKNKERYDRSVKEPFLQFIGDAGPELRKLSRHLVADPRPVGGSMFRIYRDVRFSRDKSPYKPYAAAHFPLGEGMHGPGYYLHVEPGASILAGGMWMPDAAALQAVRERISRRPADWREVRGDLDDDEAALKRPPRGFSPDDPMIDDIKRKSFTSSTRLTDEQVTRADLMKTFVRDCERLSPLMRFLASAVGASW